MLAFPAHSATGLARALIARRPAFLVAPRRSGLTRWTASLPGSLSASWVAPVYFDLAIVPGRDAFLAKLVSDLGFASVPATVQDIQVALAPGGASSSDLIIFNNLHRADSEVRETLIRVLLDRTSRPSPAELAVLVEGSVDLEGLISACFPAGPPLSPAVFYASPSSPSRELGEMSGLVREQERPAHPAIVPWLLDQTGGDVALTLSLLERLSGDADAWNEATLRAALRQVSHLSSAASELIIAAAPHRASPELAALLGCELLFGLPPESLEAGSQLKALYLAGIAAYDELAKGYRLRGALVGTILGAPAGSATFESYFRAAESTFGLSLVAVVELEIRARLRQIDCAVALREVTTSGIPQTAIRRLKTELLAQGATPEEISRVDKALSASGMGRVTLEAAADNRARAGQGPATQESRLEALTLAELATLAKRMDLLAGVTEQQLAPLTDARNDAAHFRGIGFERQRALYNAVGVLLKDIVRRP